MVRSCWAGVLLVGTFDAAFTSSSLILSVSWATRVLRYASSSEAEVIGDGNALVGMWVDGKQGVAFLTTRTLVRSFVNQKSGGADVIGPIRSGNVGFFHVTRPQPWAVAVHWYCTLFSSEL